MTPRDVFERTKEVLRQKTEADKLADERETWAIEKAYRKRMSDGQKRRCTK